MNYKTIITITFLFFSLTNVIGQDKLFLELKSKNSKKKYLDLDRAYYIKTTDTNYSNKKIVGFTDTTISITTWTEIDKDTAYTYQIIKGKDTLYSYRQPIYRKDTLIISSVEIHSLEKDWFKNKKWLEEFGWLAGAAVIGVVGLPIALIENGAAGVKEWAVFEGILVAICAPPLFIGTRKTKYNLENKWTLKVGT